MNRFKKVVIKQKGGSGGGNLRRFSRSIPYFKAILRAPSNSRWQIMHSMPAFVMNDFISVLQQIVLGRVNVGHKSGKYRLKKYQEALVDMAKAMNLAAKKRILERHFPVQNEIKKKKKGEKQVYYGQSGNGFV